MLFCEPDNTSPSHVPFTNKNVSEGIFARKGEDDSGGDRDAFNEYSYAKRLSN